MEKIYEFGTVYCIQDKDENIIYIGSTKNL